MHQKYKVKKERSKKTEMEGKWTKLARYGKLVNSTEDWKAMYRDT